VLTLVRGHRHDVGRSAMGLVEGHVVAFERLDQSGTADVPKMRAIRMTSRIRSRGRSSGGSVPPSSRAWPPRGPHGGAHPRRSGGRPRPVGVRLHLRERVVQHDRVALELEVVEALLDVDRGHLGILGHRATGRLAPMQRPVTPPLRYFSAAAVVRAMPNTKSTW
jgi:hypothetical protein